MIINVKWDYNIIENGYKRTYIYIWIDSTALHQYRPLREDNEQQKFYNEQFTYWLRSHGRNQGPVSI